MSFQEPNALIFHNSGLIPIDLLPGSLTTASRERTLPKTGERHCISAVALMVAGGLQPSEFARPIVSIETGSAYSLARGRVLD
jgi:hypothetical protein